MLARVAENLYWLGRYLERAENQARLIDVQRMLGSEASSGAGQWDFVMDALGADEEFAAAQAENANLTPLQYLVDSAESPHSIRSTVINARTLAMELREHTSREVFEAINRLYHAVQRPRVNGVGDMMEQTRNSVVTAFGLFENTVLVTEGVHWLHIGQLLERADMTSRIVDAKYFMALPLGEEVGGPLDRHQWRGVLRSTSALEAYHKTYLGSIRTERVIELLFLNPLFPRSLVYCIDALRNEFLLATEKTPPARALGPSTELAVAQLELKAQTGAQIVVAGLHEFIDHFQAVLIRVDRGLHNNLFQALPAPEISDAQQSGLSRIESLQGS